MIKTYYRAILLVTLFASIVSTHHAASPSPPASGATKSKAEDARIAKLLVGMWDSPASEDEKFTGKITYNADGTGTVVGGPIGQPNLKVTLDFKWEVVDGVLISVAVEAHFPPGFSRPNTTLPPRSVDRVVSINERQLLTEQVEGIDPKKNGTKELLNRSR